MKKTLGMESDDVPTSLDVNDTSNILISMDISFNSQAWLVELNGDGELLWEKIISGSGSNHGQVLA